MSTNITATVGTIVPTLHYYDVAAAIDWLCNAFGLEKRLVVHADDGSVRYAELTFGNGMIMLAPAEGAGLDTVAAEPHSGGAERRACYLFVADVGAHCDRAKATGAEILLDIDDAHSNGRGYSCRDLEGHVWNFGTYDPWKREPARASGRWKKPRGLRAAAASLLAGSVPIMVMGWLLGVSDLGLRSYASGSDGAGVVGALPDPLINERGGAGRGFGPASDGLIGERGERKAALSGGSEGEPAHAHRRDVGEAAELLAGPSSDGQATAQTQRALADARRQLLQERSQREEAQRGAQEARDRLGLAEQVSEAVHEQLAAERSARQNAEIAVQEARRQLAKEQEAKEAAQRALTEVQQMRARQHAAARKLWPRPLVLPAPRRESPT